MAICKECGYDKLAENARFCSSCGARISEPAPPPPARDTPETLVQVDLQVGKIAGGGRAVGTEVDRVEGSMTVVQGNLIQVHNPSPELLASLQSMQAVPTQMQPKQAAAEPADRQRLESIESNVARLLQQMDQAEQRGQTIDQVQVGQVQVSRVDLLIKQGVLLKSEAEAEILEHVGKQARHREGLPDQHLTDLDDLLVGFDTEAYQRKLQQAYDYFAEAARLDPGNVEALLHQARTAGELQLEGEGDKLLYQVVNLIGRPTDDRQRFWLAQAKYLSAMLGDTPHTGMLQEARQLFAALGETSWVQQCDLMLNPQVAGALFKGEQDSFAPTPATGAPLGNQPAFSPVGQWQVQVTSGVQMQLQYDAQGVCQGYISPGLNQASSFFNGRWGYDPASQILQQQGLVDGWSPYNFWLQVVQVTPMAFMAVDAGGFTFMFQRTG